MDALDLVCPRHRVLANMIAVRTPVADLAHDGQHLARVYRWALRLAPEAGASPDLAGAAALVHDLSVVPKDDAARPLAGERSAVEAAPLLAAAGYSAAEVAAIAAAVRTSSWSRGLAPTSALGVVLQDADRLDAIGAIGVARSVACAQAMATRGRQLQLYDPEDPLAARRAPDEARFAVDHFLTKLLGLAAAMHLPTAKREAQQRHARMVAFLEGLRDEVSAPAPILP